MGIELKIETQPDDESCGPTCLHAIYRHYGYDIPITEVIQTIDRSPSGGTFSISIGKHALQHGFQATVYINSLVLFDPSWFVNGEADSNLLIEKLEAQSNVKHDPYITNATVAIIEFLNLGGKICSHPLSEELLRTFFDKNIPVISGLSSTNLYWSQRGIFTEEGKSVFDDIRGTPCGHFVVLCGFDSDNNHVIVADPYTGNPMHHNSYYKVNINRLINAILLGVITFDGNLTVIEPKK
jgi:hypothetical protein